MNTRSQIVCAWCSIAFAVLFTIGIWPVAGFMPPLAPSLTALQVAETYQQNTLAIRSGALLMMSCTGLMCAFVAVIAVQMRRIEGRHSVLTIAQISSGTVGVVVFFTWYIVMFIMLRGAIIRENKQSLSAASN